MFSCKKNSIKEQLKFEKSDDTNSYKRTGSGYAYKKWYGKTKHRNVFEIGYTLEELAALTGVWKVNNINVIDELRASACDSDLYADVIIALADCICMPDTQKYINVLLSVCQKYIEAEKGFHLRTKSTYQYLWVKAVYSVAVKEARRLEEEQARRIEEERRRLAVPAYRQHYEDVADEYEYFKKHRDKGQELYKNGNSSGAFSQLNELKVRAKAISNSAFAARQVAYKLQPGWHGNYNKMDAIKAAMNVDEAFIKVKYWDLDCFEDKYRWSHLDSVIDKFKKVVNAWCEDIIKSTSKSSKGAYIN